MTSAARALNNVPLLDLDAQYRPLRDEILAAITRVCDSQRFIMGAEVEALERELAAYLNVREAIAVSSGTDALLAALMALGVGPDDEVVTSTYSFFATAGCISRLGATPVLVDIDPATCNLDPEAVRTRDHAADAGHHPGASLRAVRGHGSDSGVVPPNPASPSSRMPARRSARRTTAGRRARWGLPGASRSFPARTSGPSATAGSSTTNDAELAREIRLLRNHGAEPKYFHKRIGGNFRLDALQAAVLRVKLPHLAGWTDMRRDNAARYDALFAAAGLAAPDRASGRARRLASHLQPVRRAGAGSRSGSRAHDGAGHRHRDLLPGAVPPAGVLRAARPRAWRFSPGGSGRGFHACAPDLRRAERRPAGGGRQRPEPRARRVMRVLVTGARGLLGAAIAREFTPVAEVHRPRSPAAGRVRRTGGRCRRQRGCARTSSSTAPPTTTWIGAEHEPGEALRVNTFGVIALARAARQHGATLVHYSTDFVFDGETERPYTEEDRPNPRGLYAASKLLGDWFAAGAPRAYVLRVESLFGDPGPSRARRGSLGTIVDRIRAGDEVPVFVDRTVSPGYTADIAWATRTALECAIPFGMYHCVNTGAASWAGSPRRPPGWSAARCA